MRRIAILGYGQLGKHAIVEFRKDARNRVVVYRRDCGFDFLDRRLVNSIFEQNEVVINCIAMTDVDLCETCHVGAIKSNYEIPKMLAEAASAFGRKFIHISTDFVYGEQPEGQISEDAVMNPCNFYGETKAMADEFITSNCSDYLILRPSYMYGPYGSNSFVKRVLGDLLTMNYVVKASANQFIVPTTTKLVLDIAKLYIDDKINAGLYNVRQETKDGCPSKYDIAKFMQETVKSGVVESCQYAQTDGHAKRQLNSYLDISNLKAALYEVEGPCMVDILDWKTELQHTLSGINA